MAAPLPPATHRRGTAQPKGARLVLVLSLMAGMGLSFVGNAGLPAAADGAVPWLAGLLRAALFALVMAIAVIDARRFLIPDALNAGALVLGLGSAALLGGAEEVMAALARGGVLAALFWLLRAAYGAWRGREGLGLGDVKLAAVAGVWLPVALIPLAIELAAVSALLAVGARHVMGRARIRRGARLPFGLFLAPAIWVAVMADHMLWGGT